MPFERLMDELVVERDLSRNAIFQVMFELQAGFEPSFNLSGARVTPLYIERGSSKFDLTLNITQGERLTGYVEYDTSLFDAGTISRLASHFRNLLEAAIENPHTRIAFLPLMRSEEHTSELQSLRHLVCRLLLEKKNTKYYII